TQLPTQGFSAVGRLTTDVLPLLLIRWSATQISDIRPRVRAGAKSLLSRRLPTMTASRITYGIAAAALVISVAACKDKAAIARGDSLQGQLTDQQKLSSQLASQKDSLTRVVLDADAFIGSMDSAISTVKGLPKTKRGATDPLADQIQARKDMQ